MLLVDDPDGSDLRSSPQRLRPRGGNDPAGLHGPDVVGVDLEADADALLRVECEICRDQSHSLGQGNGRAAVEAPVRLD